MTGNLSAVLFLFIVLSCAHPRPAGYELPAVMVVTITPLRPYARWYEEAANCADILLRVQSAGVADYRMNPDAPESVNDIVWRIAATEDPREVFPCAIDGMPDVQACWGLTALGDTITIAGPRMLDEVTVKHEMLHVLVIADSERLIRHGLPWGFCEHVRHAQP